MLASPWRRTLGTHHYVLLGSRSHGESLDSPLKRLDSQTGWHGERERERARGVISDRLFSCRRRVFSEQGYLLRNTACHQIGWPESSLEHELPPSIEANETTV